MVLSWPSVGRHHSTNDASPPPAPDHQADKTQRGEDEARRLGDGAAVLRLIECGAVLKDDITDCGVGLSRKSGKPEYGSVFDHPRSRDAAVARQQIVGGRNDSKLHATRTIRSLQIGARKTVAGSKDAEAG